MIVSDLFGLRDACPEVCGFCGFGHGLYPVPVFPIENQGVGSFSGEVFPGNVR